MIEAYSKKSGWGQRLSWMTITCLTAVWLAAVYPASAQHETARKQSATASSSATPATVKEEARPDEQAATETEPTRAADLTDAVGWPTSSDVGYRQSDVAAESLEAVPSRVPKEPSAHYGLWVVVPAVVAILLAIFTRQVVPALVIGVLVGAYMMLPCLPAGDAYAKSNSIVGGFRLAAERYVLGAIHETPKENFAHLKIIIFTLVIGFVVGVMGRNGGTAGLVRLVAGETRSPRRGALTAWLAGMVVFFDDYANSMIVGPTMRSVFDRLKMSRAKLAYIVDSTAAPVASIALIGTWVGAEISYIQDGLDTVAAGGAALLDSQGNVLTGMQAFLYSLPYRFYPILALLLVFLVALMGRDFGPMKRSERKALNRLEPDPATTAPDPDVHRDDKSSETTSSRSMVRTADPACPPRWWLGFFPIAMLVLVTVGVLVATGLRSEETVQLMNKVSATGESVWGQQAWWRKASDVLSHSDSYLSIFYGALLSAVVAVLLTMVARACSVRDAVDAGLDGMARMFPAIVILVLAWALSTVLQDLKLGHIVATHMKEQGFQAQWLPLAVFITAALVSFATGTSWGTMGILCPMTVTTGAGLVVGLDPADATNLLYAAIGSVLAGAVFGDHCSPISDTTVLSSIACGCRHEEHVWTQIPYAVLAAITSMGLGDVLCSVYGQPWYYGLAAGAVFLFLWVLIVGRRAVPSYELAKA